MIVINKMKILSTLSLYGCYDDYNYIDDNTSSNNNIKRITITFIVKNISIPLILLLLSLSLLSLSLCLGLFSLFSNNIQI